MNNKRRAVIIVLSVSMGTFLAFLLVKSRMGTIKPSDWFQLGFNFLFAVAIVVGLGFIFKKMNNKKTKE